MRYRLIQWIEPYIGETLAAIVIPDQPVLSSIGAIVAILLATWWGRRDGLVWWKVLLVGGAAGLSGPAGGRLLWAATEWRYVIDNPILLIDPFKGGAASFGALLGAVLGSALALVLLKERTRARLWSYADVLAPPGLVGIAFARVGCLMRTCDFGRVSDLPWSVRHSSVTYVWRVHVREKLITESDPLTAAIHPFPIYLSLWGVACFALAFLRPKLFGSAPGQRATGIGALWCAGRFTVEFLRHPGDAPMIWGPINLAHLLAGGAFIILVSLNIWLGYMASKDEAGKVAHDSTA